MKYSQITSAIRERFWSKVRKTSGCWLWTDVPIRRGYGVIRFGGVKGLRPSAHRVSYLIHYKDFPQELCVLHKCDNKICIRPSHLFLGTCADNNADKARKKRGADLRGEKNNNSRFSNKDILRMRKLYVEGLDKKKIAKIFKITSRRVWEIVNYKSWKHL